GGRHRRDKMKIRLSLMRDICCRSVGHSRRLLLRPFLSPAIADDHLHHVLRPAHSEPVRSAAIYLRPGVTREMLGAALVPRRGEQRISQPPDPAIYRLPRRTVEL